MHDTDRILAELEALDGEEELEDEGVLQEYEDLERIEEMEFQPEANFGSYETGLAGPSQYEGEGEAEGEGEYEGEAEGEYEGEGEGQFEGPLGVMGESEAEGEYAGEYEGEYEGEYAGESELEGETVAGLSELQEMELAAELLDVQGEAELDHFLGGFLGKALGRVLSGPGGAKLKALLKGAAKKLIPVAGTAVGSVFGGPVGGMIGGNLASNAQKIFGLELEGLALEDQEFEAARSFVRFAADAAREMASAPNSDPAAAQAAVTTAAQRWAPGLLATNAAGPSMPVMRRRRRGMTGRWIRVSRNQIVLYGL